MHLCGKLFQARCEKSVHTEKTNDAPRETRTEANVSIIPRNSTLHSLLGISFVHTSNIYVITTCVVIKYY